jgi:hypothetical protein
MAAQTDDFEEWPIADGPEVSSRARSRGAFGRISIPRPLSVYPGHGAYVHPDGRPAPGAALHPGWQHQKTLGRLVVRRLPGGGIEPGTCACPANRRGTVVTFKEWFVFLRSTEGWRRRLSEA